MKNSKTIINEYANKNNLFLTKTEEDKLKKIIVDILVDVDSVCTQNNFNYYIAYGTLLGAVRHKGFIPWDDDVDIIMEVKSIPILIKKINETFPDKYFFSGAFIENDLDPFLGTKIMLKDSEIREVGYNYAKQKRGIFLDVFPIMSAPKTNFRKRIRGLKMKFLNVSFSLQHEYKQKPNEMFKTQDKKIKNYYRFRRFLGFLFSLNKGERLKKRRDSYYMKIYKNSSNVSILYSGLSKNEHHLTTRDFNNFSLYEFEKNFFRGPIDYNAILKIFYGENYMQLPPEEKRERHPVLYITFPKEY